MAAEARPRRRWLQFSLRSLLVLTLIAASFCGGVTYQREVNQRLRAELEQAKAEIENANRRATIAQLNAKQAWLSAEQAQLELRIVQVEVERAALEGDLKTIKTRGKATQEDFDAIISALRLRIEAALNLSAPFKPSGGLFAPRLMPISAPSDLRNRAKKFDFRGGGGKPSFPGDYLPLPKPKLPSSFDFDRPLLDRTIG